jgi:hypothetical protein
MDSEFVREYVELCEYRGVDPQKGLDFLNAQDWNDPEVVGMPEFRVSEE